MSSVKGSAYGTFGEIAGMAIGNNEIDGIAVGNNVAWVQGSDILSILSAPSTASAGTPITVKVLCNQKTAYVVTYSVVGSSMTGVGRTVTDITDRQDGLREITFTLSFGSRGTRILRIYGATQSSNATSYMSVSYVETTITVS